MIIGGCHHLHEPSAGGLRVNPHRDRHITPAFAAGDGSPDLAAVADDRDRHGLETEQMRIGDGQNSRRIMHETDPLAKLGLVKVEIELGRRLQESPDAGRPRRKIGKILRVATGLLGDIQPDHGDIPVGGKDKVRRVGVVPDIGLGAAGHIAVAGGAAPHHDDAFGMAGD